MEWPSSPCSFFECIFAGSTWSTRRIWSSDIPAERPSCNTAGDGCLVHAEPARTAPTKTAEKQFFIFLLPIVNDVPRAGERGVDLKLGGMWSGEAHANQVPFPRVGTGGWIGSFFKYVFLS